MQDVCKDSYKHLHNTTSAGEIEKLCEQQLILDMHKHSRWASFDKSWQTELLPRNELVQRKTPASAPIYHVVHSSPHACLAWPVSVDMANQTYHLDELVPELTWLVCYDISEWQVLPTRYVNPMEANRLLGVRDVVRCSVGEPAPVLHYLSGNGFPFLSEATLKKVAVMSELQLVSCTDDGDMSSKQRIALQLLAHLRDDMTEEKAIDCIRRGACIESPPEVYSELLDASLLYDVVFKKDHEDVEKELNESVIRNYQRDECASRVHAAAGHYKWHGSAPRKRTTKASKKPSYKALSANDESEMRAFLSAHAPQGAHFCLDSGSNSRVQVGYRGHKFVRKSISWTLRGKATCLDVCLDWLWEEHRKHTGQRALWNLASPQKTAQTCALTISDKQCPSQKHERTAITMNQHRNITKTVRSTV
eukprot:4179717-Amphidinium_carterae.1